jgi:hypothetical protein
VAATSLLLGGSASAFTEYERDAPWVLLGVSADGRSLILGYESGGCLRDDGRALVSENEDRIVITVRQTDVVPGQGEACPMDLAMPRTTAQLTRPIAGRTVEGGPRFTVHWPPGPVPRVIGLDRADAIAALRAQGHRARTVGRVRRGRVVAQRPRPGVVFEPNVAPPRIRLRLK